MGKGCSRSSPPAIPPLTWKLPTLLPIPCDLCFGGRAHAFPNSSGEEAPLRLTAWPPWRQAGRGLALASRRRSRCPAQGGQMDLGGRYPRDTAREMPGDKAFRRTRGSPDPA